ARHLAVASYLETGSGYEEEEIVEVVAAHYVQAYEAAPDADDAAGLKGKAQRLLTAAGEHAASLAANEEAQHYFEQAARLTDDSATRAGLFERAGQMATLGARLEAATESFERAIQLFEEAGQTHPAARVSARLGEM